MSASDANGNAVSNYLDTTYVFEIGDPWSEDESLTAVSPASSDVVYLISTEKADALRLAEGEGVAELDGVEAEGLDFVEHRLAGFVAGAVPAGGEGDSHEWGF